MAINFVGTAKNKADGLTKILGNNKISESCEQLQITYVNGGSC